MRWAEGTCRADRNCEEGADGTKWTKNVKVNTVKKSKKFETQRDEVQRYGKGEEKYTKGEKKYTKCEKKYRKCEKKYTK